MGTKSGPVGDEESLIRRCLEDGRDQGPWVVLADWYDDHGRSDAATMLRSHAPGFAAVAEHLPKVWANFVRELTRRGEYTWDALCKEAGEALACAARAAGARGVPERDDEPPPLVVDLTAAREAREMILAQSRCTGCGRRRRVGASNYCQECRAERMRALTAPM
jgi:uncharacterized protein (TIGR02996 family)